VQSLQDFVTSPPEEHPQVISPSPTLETSDAFCPSAIVELFEQVTFSSPTDEVATDVLPTSSFEATALSAHESCTTPPVVEPSLVSLNTPSAAGCVSQSSTPTSIVEPSSDNPSSSSSHLPSQPSISSAGVNQTRPTSISPPTPLAPPSSTLQLREFQSLAPMLTTVQLKFEYGPETITSMDVNEEFVVMGSSSGVLFLYDRIRDVIAHKLQAVVSYILNDLELETKHL